MTAAMAVTAGALAAPAAVAAAAPATDRHHSPTQRAMDAAVKDGVPGVTGQAKDKYGTWSGTSGVGNMETGQPRSPHDHYRVASITKTFTSTVVLQLEAEGKLDLDDTVERWLPGVVQGNGHDGSRITVRQLLNHTSGVYNMTSDPELDQKLNTEEFLKHRYDTWTADQLVAIAMRHEPDFAPGAGWSYSNTNYKLAGMIIERVTGHTYQDEIRQRVIQPLGLHSTRSPGTDPRLPQPSSRGYGKFSADPKAPFHDLTEINPSVAWASGDAISTNADLIRFYTALLRGQLLPKPQLAEMKTTVPWGEERPNVQYGLGLIRYELSCGKTVWGHAGDTYGSAAAAFTTRDGRHALAFNFNTDYAGDVEAVIEAEFCGK